MPRGVPGSKLKSCLMPRGYNNMLYKKCPEYHSELAEDAAGAFLTYDEVTWAMTDKGVDVALPILTELRSSFAPLKPSSQETSAPSSGIIQVLKVETQLPTGKGILINYPI